LCPVGAPFPAADRVSLDHGVAGRGERITRRRTGPGRTNRPFRVRILFIHNDYARYSGEEHACEAMASLLTANGHDVAWYRRSSAGIGGSIAAQVKAFFSALHNPLACRAVASLVEREKPDVAFVQNLYPLISPSVLAVLRRHRVPIVMRCPNYRLFCPNGLLFSHGEVCERCRGTGKEGWCVLRNCEGSVPKSVAYALRNAAARLGRRFMRHVSQFIVLSEFQRVYFRDAGIPEGRLSIVPNTVDPTATETVAPGGGQVISFMGRIAPEKGFEDFVAAAKRLPHLRFAAAGAVKRGHEHLVGDVPQNLKLHGFLAGDALREFVERIQVLVTCSRWFEGFPNTIACTLAAGRPVVATALGAVPEIVEDGITGLLYTPGDAEALAAHIERLAGDGDVRRRMGEAGRRKAERLYSRDAVYEALLAAIRKARDRP